MLKTVNGLFSRIRMMKWKTKLVVRMTPGCKVSPCFHAMILSWFKRSCNISNRTSAHACAYRVWWSPGAGTGPCRWPCRSAITGDPTLLRGLAPATSSFLKDWRTGEPLSIGTPWGGRPWEGPPWMSIIRTSAIRWGDGGGVFEPRVGSWLFLDFCLYREGWSMESVGLGPP